MIEVMSSLLIVSGLGFYLAGSIGLLRLPDLYSCHHCDISARAPTRPESPRLYLSPPRRIQGDLSRPNPRTCSLLWHRPPLPAVGGAHPGGVSERTVGAGQRTAPTTNCLRATLESPRGIPDGSRISVDFSGARPGASRRLE